MNYYELLGVPPNSSTERIRAAYLDKARSSHPDYYTEASHEERVAAEQQMRRVNEAWAVLGHERRRASYDIELNVAAGHRPRPGTVESRDRQRRASGPRVSTRADRRAFLGDAPVDRRPAAPTKPVVKKAPIGQRLTMLPVGLLGVGVVMMFTGWLLQAAPVVMAAVFIFFLAAVMFVALPLIAMARARK